MRGRGRRGAGAVPVALAIAIVVGLLPGCGSSATSVQGAVASAMKAGPGLLITPSGVAWAQGEGDIVMRSTDSGASWSTVFDERNLPSGCQCLGKAYFVGPDDAFVLEQHLVAYGGSLDRIWSTTDGGASWRSAVLAPDQPTARDVTLFEQMAFSGPRRGMVLRGEAPVTGSSGGNGARKPSAQLSLRLWATDDGGTSWHALSPSGLPSNELPAPTSATASCGHQGSFGLTLHRDGVAILTAEGCGRTRAALWRTTDGGLRWHPESLPPPTGGWTVAAGGGPLSVGAPRFVSSSTAVLPVTGAGGNLLVYRSSNGGASWAFVSLLSTGSLTPPSGFAALSADTFAQPASDGTWWTHDGGAHWSLARSAASLGSLAAVDFVSSAVGLASNPGEVTTGGLGETLRTVDGGRKWEYVQAAPGAAPEAGAGPGASMSGITTIDFSSAAHGYAGGPAGLGETTDGGLVWQPLLLMKEWWPPTDATGDERGPPQLVFRPGSAGGAVDVDFVDDDHGFVLTSDELLRTSDGGTSWVAVGEPPAGALTAVRFFNADSGVGAVCEAGGFVVERTSDAGQIWSPVTLPPGTIRTGDCIVPPREGSGGVCFATPSTGWAIARDGALIDLWRTTDGGATWRHAPGGAAGASAPPALVGCSSTTVWGAAVDRGGTGSEPYGLFALSLAASGGRATAGEDPAWVEVVAHRSAGASAPVLAGAPVAASAAAGPQGPMLGPLDVVGDGVAFSASLCYWCETPGHPGFGGDPAGGTIVLRRTLDAGSSWQPERPSLVLAAAASASGPGAADSAGGVPATTGAQPAAVSGPSGGAVGSEPPPIWQGVLPPASRAALPEIGPAGNVLSLDFVSATTGFVLGTTPGEPATLVLLGTTDGGATWQSLPVSTG